MALAVVFQTVGFLAVAPSAIAGCPGCLRSTLLAVEAVAAAAERRALSSGPEALAVVFAALALGATALMGHRLRLNLLCFRGLRPGFVVKQLQLLQLQGRRFLRRWGLLVVGEELLVEVGSVLVLEEGEVGEGKRASVLGETGLHVSNIAQ